MRMCYNIRLLQMGSDLHFRRRWLSCRRVAVIAVPSFPLLVVLGLLDLDITLGRWLPSTLKESAYSFLGYTQQGLIACDWPRSLLLHGRTADWAT